MHAPPGSTLSLYPRYFSLSGRGNCTHSALTVRDGASLGAPLLARLCGHALPATLHSTGPALFLQLESGQGGYSSGYDLSYSSSSAGRGCGGVVTGTRGAVLDMQ